VCRGEPRDLVVVEPRGLTAASHLQLSLALAPLGGKDVEEEEGASQVGGDGERRGRRGDGDAEVAPPSRPSRALPRIV
jgi:hypothetical protein